MHLLNFKYKYASFSLLTLCVFASIFFAIPLNAKEMSKYNPNVFATSKEPAAREFYDMAIKLFYAEEHDSAFNYFREAAALTLAASPEKADSTIAAKSHNMMGAINFYRGSYFDSYQHYLKALEIGGEEKFYWVRINIAGVLSLYKSYGDAEKQLIIAYEHAKKDKAWDYLLNAYSMLVGQRMLLDNVSGMKELVEDFESLSIPKNEKGPALFLIKVSQAMKEYASGQYDAAIASFNQARTLNECMWTPVSADVGCMLYIAKTYQKSKRPEDAVESLKEAEKIAIANDLSEYRIEIYDLLTKCLAEAGNIEESKKYKMRYFEFSDSIMSLAEFSQIKDVTHLKELEGVEQSAQEAKLREQHNTRIMYITISGLVIFIILFVTILILYRRLSAKNKLMFSTYNEVLKQKAAHGDRKKTTATATESPNNTEITDNVHKLDVSANLSQEHDNAEDTAKQDETSEDGNLRINQEERFRIRANIENFFEESDEWHSSDFSMERLVQLVDSNKLYVSYVINNDMGTNYHELLNSYRVKEVCHRLINEHEYGNMTMESIAAEVGYKSRSNFIKNFKKQTGLTPKTWQALAQKNAAD